jgi:sn-glycerol 3-phosphate transport system permease protein
MPDAAKKGSFRLSRVTPYFYILPSLVLFIIFVFYPFVKTVYLSLHTTDPNGAVVSFQGIGNYISTLQNANFLFSLEVTLKFALIVVTGSIAMGLITGILVNEAFPARGLFRTLYAMPMAVSSACISVIMLFIMHPQLGILNYVLGTNIKWLTGVKYALGSVAAVTIWMNVGLNFIFVIAALQSVNDSLYEACAIEGAGFFRKHWHVTLPSIMPTLFFLLIINVIGSFQAVGQIHLLTQGGPGKYTQVIVYTIYLEAFTYNRLGVASTQSVILFAIIFILTVIQFRLERKVTYG